jgi:hypothetical protein
LANGAANGVGTAVSDSSGVLICRFYGRGKGGEGRAVRPG